MTTIYDTLYVEVHISVVMFTLLSPQSNDFNFFFSMLYVIMQSFLTVVRLIFFPMESACLHKLVKNFMLHEIKWILMEENHVEASSRTFFSLNEKLDKVSKPSVSLGFNDKVCCFLLVDSIYFIHLLKFLVIVDVVLVVPNTT